MAWSQWLVLTIISLLVSHDVSKKNYGSAVFGFCLFLMSFGIIFLR